MLDVLRSDITLAFFSVMLIVSAVFYSRDDEYRYWLYWYVSFLIFAFMAVVMVGSRPLDAGNDTMGYANAFMRLTDLSSAHEVGQVYYGNQEFLFWLFSAVLKLLTSNPALYILIVACISFLIVAACIFFTARHALGRDYLLYPTLCLCVFFTYALVYVGNHVRASLAVPLCISALALFTYRYYKPAAVLFVLSLGFHISTLSALPAFVLLKILPENDAQKLRVYAVVMIVASLLMSFVYQTILQYLPGNVVGVDLEGKMALYYNETFAIQSVFKTLTFWVIAINVMVFIVFGISRIHFISIYYFCLSLFLSPIPILSERYFLYSLILLPLLLYMSLKEKLPFKQSALALVGFYCLSGLLMNLSPGAKYTLALLSFIR